MRLRPDFFIVGAPKCGTTAMADYLNQHPEVAMCTVKEVHYFGRDIQADFDLPGSWRPRRDEEYLELFPDPDGAHRAGDASVWYLYSRDAPAEMLRFEPRAKALIMLRDPVEMVYSLHSQLVYLGSEHEPDFSAALDLDGAREAGELPRPYGFPTASYRAAGRYAEHVVRYLRAFGPERVLVILFDEFRADPLRECRRACEFVGVDPRFAPLTPVVNPNKRARSRLLRRLTRRPPRPLRWTARAVTTRSKRAAMATTLTRLNTRYEPRAPLAPEVRERLTAELAPDVRRLGELLDVNLDHWTGPDASDR